MAILEEGMRFEPIAIPNNEAQFLETRKFPLRKNRTIDWEKRDDARAKMRMMVKKLLKRYKYPPEGMDDAVQTVLAQCELWTDNEVGA